jgi:hypothetical protein
LDEFCSQAVLKLSRLSAFFGVAPRGFAYFCPGSQKYVG